MRLLIIVRASERSMMQNTQFSKNRNRVTQCTSARASLSSTRANNMPLCLIGTLVVSNTTSRVLTRAQLVSRLLACYNERDGCSQGKGRVLQGLMVDLRHRDVEGDGVRVRAVSE